MNNADKKRLVRLVSACLDAEYEAGHAANCKGLIAAREVRALNEPVEAALRDFLGVTSEEWWQYVDDEESEHE